MASSSKKKIKNIFLGEASVLQTFFYQHHSKIEVYKTNTPWIKAVMVLFFYKMCFCSMGLICEDEKCHR